MAVNGVVGQGRSDGAEGLVDDAAVRALEAGFRGEPVRPGDDQYDIRPAG